MQLCPIRSGSKGNAILIKGEKTNILVDCGISGKKAEEGLKAFGLEASDLSGILVTHEHRDHTAGIGVFVRRHGIPVYMNQKTWIAMQSIVGKIQEELIHCFDHTQSFMIKSLEIKPFSISHDAADPVGYGIIENGKKISIATDIGVLEESLFRAIRGSDGVLLESNHDLNMLDIGSYPLSLKNRIRGNYGHLSNDDAGKAAEFLVRMGTKNIMLGHLSQENNYPILAKQTVVNILKDAGIEPGRDMNLEIAPRNSVGRSMVV